MYIFNKKLVTEIYMQMKNRIFRMKMIKINIVI